MRITGVRGRHGRSRGLRALAFLLAASLTLFRSGTAAAQQYGARIPANPSPANGPFFALGFGWFDVLGDGFAAVDMRVEYRHHSGLWRFRPWIGLEATSDEAVYGVGGIRYEQPVGPLVILTASVGGGVFADGGGKPLNHVLQFRSQFEAALRLGEVSRLGVALSHISNASLAEQNPGAEVLTLYYAVAAGGGPSSRGVATGGPESSPR